MAFTRTSRPSSRSGSSRASIEASMSFLDIDMGKISIPAEAGLYNLLDQCFARIRGVFNLRDPASFLSKTSTFERVLNAIFDTGSLPFVTEKSVRIAAGLDDHEKACLFIQAVAGMVLVFKRLDAAAMPVSSTMLDRELQLFAESEQRRIVLETISSRSLVNMWYTKNALIDFLVETLDEPTSDRHDSWLAMDTGRGDFVSDVAAWVNDRPCKNMGLPWGFTIMALN